MTTRLDRIANTAIIVLTTLASFHYLSVAYDRWSGKTAASAARTYYQNGDHAPQIPGVSFAARPQTLVLVVSKSCPYCAESMPFYNELFQAVAARPARTQLVILAPQPVPETRAYLAEHQIQTDAVVSVPLASLRVHGTPTLLLIDQRGTIRQTWAGLLDEPRRQEVMKQALPPA